jgi:thymidylate kinase
VPWLRPSGKTVAIIGPDGSGKSTLINSLEQGLSQKPRRIYMGINPSAITHTLPTTRLIWFIKRLLNIPLIDYESVRKADEKKPQGPKKLHKRVLGDLKSTLFVINRVSEQWYRQFVGWYYQWRGELVLFDRHFYLDYMALKLARPNERKKLLAWRIHDFLLEHVYPKPYLTLYLDAPADVLFARKQEISMERLEEMRQVYLQLGDYVPRFTVLDATMPAEDVLDAAKQTFLDMIE